MSDIYPENLPLLLDEEVGDLQARSAVHRAVLTMLVTSYLAKQDKEDLQEFGYSLDAIVKNLVAKSRRPGEGSLPAVSLKDELRGILGKFVKLLPG